MTWARGVDATYSSELTTHDGYDIKCRNCVEFSHISILVLLVLLCISISLKFEGELSVDGGGDSIVKTTWAKTTTRQKNTRSLLDL